MQNNIIKYFFFQILQILSLAPKLGVKCYNFKYEVHYPLLLRHELIVKAWPTFTHREVENKQLKNAGCLQKLYTIIVYLEDKQRCRRTVLASTAWRAVTFIIMLKVKIESAYTIYTRNKTGSWSLYQKSQEERRFVPAFYFSPLPSDHIWCECLTLLSWKI